MLLFTFAADWFVVAVVAVVFESVVAPKVEGDPLFTIFRGGALPLRSVLEKVPPADPGYFTDG